MAKTNTKSSKFKSYERYQITIGATQTLILALTLLCAIYIGIKQNNINQGLLDLNFAPSLMVTYENDRINVKNMGSQNVWIWGKKIGSRKPMVEKQGRLLTPGGLYFFDAKSLEDIIQSDMQSDSRIQIPFEFFVQTENQKRYVLNNLIYFNTRDGKLKTHIQTIGIIKMDWSLH